MLTGVNGLQDVWMAQLRSDRHFSHEPLYVARWLQRSVVYREDATGGVNVAEERARILAQAGAVAAALDEIEQLLAGPGFLSVHTLRLDPRWDPIREHPRFQALLSRYENLTRN